MILYDYITPFFRCQDFFFKFFQIFLAGGRALRGRNTAGEARTATLSGPPVLPMRWENFLLFIAYVFVD